MAQRSYKPNPHYTKEDWDSVASPPLTDAELRSLRPIAEVLPELARAARASATLRDNPKGPAKVALSIRLDPDALAAFKATGPGWQRRINDALVKAARKLG